jgi:hypothetical protein
LGKITALWSAHVIGTPGGEPLVELPAWNGGRGGQPSSQATDYYLWYNCTMAMFQAGGQPWDRWNNALRDHVVGMHAIVVDAHAGHRHRASDIRSDA